MRSGVGSSRLGPDPVQTFMGLGSIVPSPAARFDLLKCSAVSADQDPIGVRHPNPNLRHNSSKVGVLTKAKGNVATLARFQGFQMFQR